MNKPIHVLYSPSSKRVVWSSGGGISMTSVVENGSIVKSVHSAAVSIDEMSKLFSNKNITDWEQRIIQTWSEL